MKNENLIQKQILQLDIHAPVASPLALQEATAKWCSEVLIHAIGKRLEKYSEIKDVIRIDKIAIQLDTGESLNEILAEKVASEVDKEIQLELTTKHMDVVQKEETLVEAFVFFLENGYLPWWSNIKNIEELVPVLQFASEKERSRFEELFENKKIVNRFSKALPLKNFITMLSQLFEVSEKQISSFFQKIEKLGSIIQNNDLQYQFLILVKQEYLNALAKKKDEVIVVRQATDLLLGKYQLPFGEIRNYIQSDELLSTDFGLRQTLKKMIDSRSFDVRNEPEQFVQDGEKITTDSIKSKQQTKQIEQKQDGIYIANAGLVLLTPFIPRFFENLGIVENGVFNSKDLALAMLQWLVTGNELHAEFNLVLPKIICGMEPEEPAVIIPYLPGGFKKEGEILLQSVIEHWSILKNTSIPGLRESFLQREGKLSFQNNEWLLQVDQKPYDMLLEHLTWNISMIRLSWMPYLLRTEWVG